MLIKIISLYLFFSVIALSIMFVSSFSRGQSSISRAFGALALTLDIYLLGYLLELNVSTLEASLFWNQVQYFGIPFFPGFWLLVSMLYTGKTKGLLSLHSVTIFALPLVTLFMRLTNASHHLFYSSAQMNNVAGNSFMLLGKGPWYMVHILYVLVTLLLSTAFYYQRFLKSTREEKKQFQLLLFASVIPYLALILVTLNIGGNGIDYTALILPPCIVMINIALSKFNFLEIKLLARERAFEESHEGLLILDKTYTIKDFNPASAVFFSWFGAQLLRLSIQDVMSHQPEVLAAIFSNEVSTFDVLFEEQIKHLSFSTTPLKSGSQDIGYLLAIEDVTEKELLNKRLLEMARTDALTGMNNRRYFVEQAEKAFDRALRYEENLTLLMLDIDHFKRINDSYGHSCGDSVLKAVAANIKSSFRGTDICGRFGGEEFSILMLNTTPEEAYHKAELFRSDLNAFQFVYQDIRLTLSVSIGIAHFIYSDSDKGFQTPKSLDELVSRADSAMYKAKNSGRNRTCC